MAGYSASSSLLRKTWVSAIAGGGSGVKLPAAHPGSSTRPRRSTETGRDGPGVAIFPHAIKTEDVWLEPQLPVARTSLPCGSSHIRSHIYIYFFYEYISIYRQAGGPAVGRSLPEACPDTEP